VNGVLGDQEVVVTRRVAARISVLLLCIHGLIEVIGPLALTFDPQAHSGFVLGGLEGQQFESQALAIAIIGAVWGIVRFVAGWGIWSMRRWAIVLGIVMSAITMTAAISVIPAGVVDTAVSVPPLVLLLYAWFGQDRLSHPKVVDQFHALRSRSRTSADENLPVVW
jgi:uncharacterized membrane protein (DUF2068 family)